MYHTIEDLCKKVEVIQKKAENLRNLQHRATADPKLIEFEIADIQALCADIANDRETV